MRTSRGHRVAASKPRLESASEVGDRAAGSRDLRPGPQRARSLALALVLALLLPLGCNTDAQGPRRSLTALPDPASGAPLSEELMLALSMAKTYHHKADVFLQENRAAEAAEAVAEILSIRFPADAPEAEDVRLDARARLAKLLASRDQLTEAMAVVDAGLEQQPRRSFFLANLYTVKGELHELRAVELDPSDENAARDQRRAAITAFDESIRINRDLQEALLQEVTQ
ncbi:hypothetical protein [Haliangium ochraceum]|uniref:Uncharacterized protein n=1 Tax=Haliangium ochraceum (strain DSM 14365 / JCM 11303 / SMP-2) TaxID=502025 RepID=D0LGW6_HALO1|nr:hypothetical protein [Haliangium ochraceum]ACY14688.1 hypothetical protein Hoch_2143 [Haliangium ochraceum DSM 14365]